mmetsp:Transcript_54657/g.98148  ORF Transcript_54657/g.98148 Transcript_54657/m.98148 type:complete len:324 (-) Transcript_54657:39-1010(-)
MSGGGKLFLGGLAGQTTKETLQYYFGQFGNVVDAVVMAGRGFGFVTFDSADTANHVLSLEHVLDERTIDCKAADMKGGQKGGGGKGDYAAGPPQPSYGGASFGGAYTHSAVDPYSGGGGSKGGSANGGGGTTDKIFVGGLPVDTSDEALRSYFEVYGTLVDVVVMKDRMTQKPRGFGFVQYDNFESAEKVMADYASHKIGGKWVECKRATPQDKSAGGKGGGGMGCNGGKMSGGPPPSSYQPYGGYQAPAGGAAYNPYGVPSQGGYGAPPAYGGANSAPAYGGGGYAAPAPDYGAYGAYGGGKGYAPAPAYGGKGGKGKYSPY